MTCTQCGGPLPDDANFCPSCGAPNEPPTVTGEDTGAVVDLGELDPAHELGEVPDLAPGTGMLVVVRGPNAGSRWLLDRPATRIGRHPDADIFLDDVTVSRRHAELLRDDNGRMAIHDLQSLNGSYVNGERVEQRDLATGDELQIGRFKLLFVGAASDPEVGGS